VKENSNIVKALVKAHWSYIEAVLISHGEHPDVIKKCMLHYCTAFEHGYKHGYKHGQAAMPSDVQDKSKSCYINYGRNGDILSVCDPDECVMPDGTTKETCSFWHI